MDDGIVLADALRLVGRSVFANQFLKKGQLVMQAPTAQLDSKQCKSIREADLGAYCMAHPADPDGGLLLLSEAALCLAPDEACLIASATNVGPSGWIVEFHAARDIQEGELLARQEKVDRWRMA